MNTFSMCFKQLKCHFYGPNSPCVLQAEPVRVLVTGAAGQIAYSLLFSIAKGDVFGKDQVRCFGSPTRGQKRTLATFISLDSVICKIPTSTAYFPPPLNSCDCRFSRPCLEWPHRTFHGSRWSDCTGQGNTSPDCPWSRMAVKLNQLLTDLSLQLW